MNTRDTQGPPVQQVDAAKGEQKTDQIQKHFYLFLFYLCSGLK